MGNTPAKRGSPLRTSSQGSGWQRRAGAKTSSGPSSEPSSEPSSSEPSNGVFHRLNRGLVLPSASSQANLQQLTKKLAAGSLARRNTSIAANKHIDKTVPRTDESILYSKDQETQDRIHSLSAGLEPKRNARVYRTSRNTVDDWDETLDSRTLASQVLSHSDQRRGIRAPNAKHQNGKLPGENYPGRTSADEETEESIPDLEASGSLQITEQWMRVNQRRGALRETFERVKGERTRLLDIRKNRNGAYQKLKLKVQKILPDNPDLFQLFQQLDHLELSYQNAEITVDDLIDEVHEGEVQLELEERKFFTNLIEGNPSSGTLSRASSRDTLRGIEGDRPVDKHPLLEALQASHQELKLAKESLNDLNKRQQLLLLRPYHEWLREEEEFMGEFLDLELQTQETIHHWSASVAHLQKQCQEQNLIPGDENFQSELSEAQDLSEDIYLDELIYPGGALRSDLTHPRFGVLLTNPSHLLRSPPETARTFLRTALSLPKSSPRRQDFIEGAKKEFGIESLLQASESEDKVRYINRWLLHRLRLSPMEAELLLVQFVAVLKLPDPENWQHDVLFYWSRDSAATERTAPAKEAADNDVSNEASLTASTDLQDRSSDWSSISNNNHKQSAPSSRI